MIPKSMAPIEIRLAESPRNTIIMKVNSSDRGMDSATTNEARKSPRNASNIKATRIIPSRSVWVTVRVVTLIRLVRS